MIIDWILLYIQNFWLEPTEKIVTKRKILASRTSHFSGYKMYPEMIQNVQNSHRYVLYIVIILP